MKIFNLGYTSLKTLETVLEICFVEDILDAMIKRTPVGFLCILEIQHMIGRFLFFLCDFKT